MSLLKIVAGVAGVVLSAAAAAGPYEDGYAAFHGKDYVVAMELWTPLAEAGDARAQVGLARLYLGGYGVARDDERAVSWLRKAAEQDDPAAHYMLGSMHRDGHGVEKDASLAVSMLRKAADRGHHWAQYGLGLMYHVGEGVPRDAGEAYLWLTLAMAVPAHEEHGLRATASFLRDEVASKMTRAEIDEAARRVRQWKPSSR
jgi:TPR repeat protein